MSTLVCAFVTHYPMPDVRMFSGISYFMARHLELAGVKVLYVAAPLPEPSLFFRLRQKLYRRLFGWGMRLDRDPAIMRNAGGALDQKLRSLEFDFILTPGSLAVSYLQDARPKFFWSDATFAGYINFSEEFTGMSPETILRGNQLEQRSISACADVFYSSDWAAETARKNYCLDPSRVHVIPYGANFDSIPDGVLIRRAIMERSFDEIRLLFCGVEWERKGGPLALKVVEHLKKEGRRVRLDLFGCEPCIPASVSDSVVVHGFVSKKTKEGQQKMAEQFQSAHFLLLPARQEACAIAFCEASAYGLPVLASEVGGCGTVVRNEINGHLFPLDVEPSEVAKYIRELIEEPQRYQSLALSSRHEFEERLNWPVATATLLEQIKSRL